MKVNPGTKEYYNIYMKGYAALKRRGIKFKFRVINDGWYKIFIKENKKIGYEYNDIIYGKEVTINTLNKVGYKELIALLNKTVTYNSVRYIITGYSAADLCQFQYKTILEKIVKFKPEKKNKINTFMCRCLHNAILNETKKHNTLSRCPRITGGTRKDIANILPLDESRISQYDKAQKDFNLKRNQKDIEKILTRENDKVRRLVKQMYFYDYGMVEAARKEGISIKEAKKLIGMLRKNKALMDFLTD